MPAEAAPPKRVGFWTRLRRAFVITEEESAAQRLAEATAQRRREAEAEAAALARGAAAAEATPTRVQSEAEQQIRKLLDSLERTDQAAAPEPTLGPDSPELAAGFEQLVREGHEPIACELLERLLARAPQTALLRVRLCELLVDRGEEARARPHLDLLIADAQRAHAPGQSLGSAERNRLCKAHFLLGQCYEREHELGRALRHFEAVLAIDLDWPGARGRASRLRTRLGDAAPAPAALAPTVAGGEGLRAAGARYRILGELGRGGAAPVYLARDEELGREIALKLLHPHLAASARADARARFFAEARIAAAVRHPAIIAIYDVDEAARLIVMEHCAGGSLRERLRRGPLGVAASLVRHVELLDALAAVHDRGVVHRDLKPGNLLFRGDPDDAEAALVLADFGVAHLAADGAGTGGTTQGGREAVGTLLYMSPEQRRGERATPAGDLFAAGVILYQTIAGEAPWDPSVLLSEGERGMSPAPLGEAVLDGLPGELAEALHSYLASLLAPTAAARPTRARAARAVAQLLADATADLGAWRARKAAGLPQPGPAAPPG
ncbi:MAG: protein kinase [Deltaproteobacteria bacterium]|nr:protein kinase [Deltaproteobacteria bacterium]